MIVIVNVATIRTGMGITIAITITTIHCWIWVVETLTLILGWTLGCPDKNAAGIRQKSMPLA